MGVVRGCIFPFNMADDGMDFTTSEQHEEPNSSINASKIDQVENMDDKLDDSDDSSDSEGVENEEITSLREFVSKINVCCKDDFESRMGPSLDR